MPNRKTHHRERSMALLRYQKQRQRNLLANPGVHGFTLVLDHLKASFNVPKIFRSAEVFGASEIHLIGIGPFDPAPAKGAFKRVPARFHDDFDSCHATLKAAGYSLFALDSKAEKILSKTVLPEKSAFIFGHEELGLSFSPEAYPDIRKVGIPQYGHTESLNVSVAASIVMYEYVRRVC